MSIRNISTHKKKTKYQKLFGVKKVQNRDYSRFEGLQDVSKKLSIPALSNQIDQKQLDSHRAPLAYLIDEFEDSKDIINENRRSEDGEDDEDD